MVVQGQMTQERAECNGEEASEVYEVNDIQAWKVFVPISRLGDWLRRIPDISVAESLPSAQLCV